MTVTMPNLHCPFCRHSHCLIDSAGGSQFKSPRKKKKKKKKTKERDYAEIPVVTIMYCLSKNSMYKHFTVKFRLCCIT